MRAADARALTSTGIATVVPVTGASNVFAVEVEGRPVGCVMHTVFGWLALDDVGVVIARDVSRRHAAVRRLLMHYDYHDLLAPGGPPDD